MAILQGKAADEWIKANPGSTYRQKQSDGSYKVVEPDQGFIVNTARDVIRPFYDLARGTFDVANKFSGQKASALTPEEQAHPLRFAAQTAAGLASYAVPGVGKGLVKPITQGLFAGGLNTLSRQRVDKPINLEEVGGGALVGGAVGGALGLAGKALNRSSGKIAEFGKEMQNKVDLARVQNTGLKGSVGKVEGALPELVQSQKNLTEILSQQGKKLTQENVNALKESLNQVINESAAGVSNATTVGELQKTILDSISNGRYTPQMIKQADEIASQIVGSAIGRPVSPNQLVKLGNQTISGASLKRAYDTASGLSQEALDVINRGGQPKISGSMAADIRTGVSNFMKSKIPNTEEAFRQLSDVHTILPDLERAALNPSTINVLGNEVPDLGISKGIASKAIGGAGKVATLAQKSAPILQNLGKFISQPQVVKTAALASVIQATARKDPEAAQSLQSALESGDLQDYEYAALDANTVQQQRVALVQRYMATQPKAKLSDAIAYVNFVLPATPKLSSADSKVLRDTGTARRNLESLKAIVEPNKDYFNPISGQPIFGEIAKFTGDATRASLQTRIAAVGQEIAKSLEGGKLSDRDRIYYQTEVLPQLTDSPDRMYEKIAALEELIANRETEARQLLGQSGLNLSIQ